MRSDALRILHARSRSAANVQPMRMEPRAVPALPDGAKADLIFMCAAFGPVEPATLCTQPATRGIRPATACVRCDVFESIEPARREDLVRSLRAILAPAGRLVVIERRALEHQTPRAGGCNPMLRRQHPTYPACNRMYPACNRMYPRRELETDAFLVDILDAGFLQQRTAQHVAGRRVLLFGADPAAASPPPPPPPPPLLDEDMHDEEEEPPPPPPPLPSAATGLVEAAVAAEPGLAAGGDEGCLLEDNAVSREVDDEEEEEEEEGCLLEENVGAVLREEEEEDEADGPVLEDNDEGEEDSGCLLEDN